MCKKVTFKQPRKITYYTASARYLRGIATGIVRTSSSFCVHIKQEWFEWIRNCWRLRRPPEEVPQDFLRHSITINFKKQPKRTKRKNLDNRKIIRYEFENGDVIEIESELHRVA